MQKNKKTIFIIIAILIVTFSYFGIKKSGLHIEGIKLVKGGEISIGEISENTKIFLDNKEVKLEQLKNVAPGDYSVLVASDALWPWKKDTFVSSDNISELFPFLVSKSVSGEIITQSDPEYKTLRSSILNNQLPTTDSPILSDSGLVEVWSNQNNIFAKWNGDDDEIPPYFCSDDGECSSLVAVLESESEVRNISFFKGRDDILLIASQNGIFAIEIDRRGNTQNFQPVYKGTSLPIFISEDDSTIYVLDGALLFLVSI